MERLSLFALKDNTKFTYKFESGINYFTGKNDSGKTEFYTFIDFMFGANEKLSEKVWFKDTLSHAELQFAFQNREYIITRYLADPNKNYIEYSDEANENEVPAIRLGEYREKLNLVFSQSDDTLKELRSFMEEDVGYRTFTVFNFLGEKRQGVLNDFFDKCSNIQYVIKMPGLLNYIFNKHIAEIEKLKKRESELKKEIGKLEATSSRNDDIMLRVNRQLKVLRISKAFKGNNPDEIRNEISKLQTSLDRSNNKKKSRTITELETIYTSLDEQLKRQQSFLSDHKNFIQDDEKQKQLLETLKEIINQNPNYEYLVEPIIKLTNELDKSISFNNYLIQESSTQALRKRRDEIRQELLECKHRYSVYSVSDKARAITLVNEYLGYYDEGVKVSEVLDKKSELRDVQKRIRELQLANDRSQIENLSKDITQLYKATRKVSDLSLGDFDHEGFRITYIKNGNLLQPQILSVMEESGNTEVSNFYTGSLARHTLIQLCGYLGFLRMLIRENKYPLIPILVIDHISKPFDGKNMKSIGAVLHEAYSGMDKENLQIILFDDEDASSLGIQPDYETDLLADGKTGFNPFYHGVTEERDNR